MNHLYFWQNIVSPHQSAFIKALSLQSNVKVTLIVERKSMVSRQSMGWLVPDVGDAKIIVAPTNTEIIDILKNDVQATHIFSGTRAYPLVWSALKQALKLGRRVGLMSEPGDWFGVSGLIRLIRSRFDGLYLSRKVLFVLAIGFKGVDWFTRSGYPVEKIFDWGYFIDYPDQLFGEREPGDGLFSIIYVGRLVKAKGLEMFLHSVAKIDLDYSIQIIGEGPERVHLQHIARKNGLEQKIRFVGFMSNSEVLKYIAQSDLLVLPSVGKDGWGAVVNEALMVGTPAICSLNCGASVLLADPTRGYVFNPKASEPFHIELRRRIMGGPIKSSDRERIRDWANHITGRSAAKYFLDVLNYSFERNGERPKAPWLN